MTDNDTWGRDPQIRYMRGVFAAIEAAQKGFLQAVGVSSRDEHLRRFREIALKLFERSWASAMQRGIGSDERSAAAIYIFCLAEHCMKCRYPMSSAGGWPPEKTCRWCLMIRLRLFGRFISIMNPRLPSCGARHNSLGAWFRSIDLVTPQKLKGEELLRRTRGWWTVEPDDVAEVVRPFGRFVVGDGGELMVEFESQDKADSLADALKERFGDQVQLAP